MAIDALPYLIAIEDGLWLVRGPAKGRFPHCHAVLLAADQTVLIDAGIGIDRIRDIDARTRIDALIISHSHPDHILAWHVLADRTLYMPMQTPESVADLKRLGQRFVDNPRDAAYWTWVAEHRLGIQPMRHPDHRFDDGDILDFGRRKLKAIHTPGHLDDHYCFMETNSGTLFSIDIDFTGFGPWYGNPEGDIQRFRESVHRLRTLPFTRICPAHKAPIHQAAAPAAFDRYLAAFDRQRALVLELCRQPTDLAAMVDASPFYRHRMPDATLQRIFETQMIKKNVALLMAEGLVAEARGRYITSGR